MMIVDALLVMRKGIVENKRKYLANNDMKAFQAAIKMLRELDAKLANLGYSVI